MKPSVSVVIPTHNRAALLGTALRSVLDQTFQDFEVLVVDDGSNDGTAEVRRQFADARIHWLRHETPRGGAAARNTGIVHARGDYIALLDDDDEWYPDKLARQMEVMRKSPADVAGVYTGYLIVDRASGRVQGCKTPSLRGDLHAALLRSNPMGGSSSMLLRRACLDKVGLFDESLPSFQDRDLWIRLAREFRFEYVEAPLLHYYVHDKRVWTNPEALIKGLEIMLTKYGSSRTFRRQCSNRYVELGVRFCAANQMGRGRGALWRSIVLHPYRLRPYVYLALTVLGPQGFARARALKASLPPSGAWTS